jgi:hypothetical protein
MKAFLGRLSVTCLIVLVVVGMTVSPSQAWSRGAHHWRDPHVWWGPRIYIGPPVVWAPYPYYTYSPSYTYSPPVVVESPPVYIQQQPAAPTSWYYCQEPQGYYPYVSECPGGWTPVAPTPAAR